MHAVRTYLEPGRPHKPFELPPELDMGLVKLDDLYFDLAREVARLRAASQRPT